MHTHLARLKTQRANRGAEEAPQLPCDACVEAGGAGGGGVKPGFFGFCRVL